MPHLQKSAHHDLLPQRLLSAEAISEASEIFNRFTSVLAPKLSWLLQRCSLASAGTTLNASLLGAMDSLAGELTPPVNNVPAELWAAATGTCGPAWSETFPCNRWCCDVLSCCTHLCLSILTFEICRSTIPLSLEVVDTMFRGYHVSMIHRLVIPCPYHCTDAPEWNERTASSANKTLRVRFLKSISISRSPYVLRSWLSLASYLPSQFFCQCMCHIQRPP
jgi:hypothetical protein